MSSAPTSAIPVSLAACLRTYLPSCLSACPPSQVSLRTLRRVVSATRFVVKPYLRYPKLLDSILTILRGSNVPWSLRREVLRTLGVLGALDPTIYGQIQLFLRDKEQQLQWEALAAGSSLGGVFCVCVFRLVCVAFFCMGGCAGVFFSVRESAAS